MRVMKTIIAGLLLLCFAGSALALDKAELDNRIRKLSLKFDALQAKPDKRVPAEILSKAQGIIFLDRTKAGFLFAFQGGSGVAMVKEPKTDQWSPSAFLNASEASLGFQIGGQQSFIVILLMSTNATRMLTDSKFDFGGEARGTAGDSSAGAEGNFSSTEQPVLIYSDHQGLYGGAAIKGGAISFDLNANLAYYNQAVSMQDILFDKRVKPTQAATDLAAKIVEHAKK